MAKEQKVLTVPPVGAAVRSQSQHEDAAAGRVNSTQGESSLVEWSRLLAGLAWLGLATTDDNLRMSLNSHTAHKSCMCFMAKELPRGF